MHLFLQIFNHMIIWTRCCLMQFSIHNLRPKRWSDFIDQLFYPRWSSQFLSSAVGGESKKKLNLIHRIFKNFGHFRNSKEKCVPQEDTASFNSERLQLVTCLAEARMLAWRVGPAPTVLPWQSKRNPWSKLQYAPMFSSSAFTSGVSPHQSIPAARWQKQNEQLDHISTKLKCIKTSWPLLPVLWWYALRWPYML